MPASPACSHTTFWTRQQQLRRSWTMAFEVPIEADSPNNDAGLISSLIKAPISGLMWILGMKENNQRAGETQLLSTAETSDTSAPEIICNFSEWHKTKGILSDRPGAVSSDTSEASDHETSACCSKEERTDNDCFDLSEIQSSSSRNNITWSDESGSSLVFYCDEVSLKSLNILFGKYI